MSVAHEPPGAAVPPAPDTDRPPPPNAPDIDRIGALFLGGRIAQEARSLRLEGRSIDEVHRLLVARAFRPRVERLFAGRGPNGEALFHLRSGETTMDPRSAECLAVLVYAHTDGSLVRVYPEGDPTGRRAPVGVPTATKSVCMYPPRAWVDEEGTARFSADTSPKNEAFRVTESGDPTPKGFRAVDGVKSESTDPLVSWRLAVARVGARGAIRLRV